MKNVEHNPNPWCWCHPRIKDDGFMMHVLHRDIDPAMMPGMSSFRILHGGPQCEDKGEGAIWVNEVPT